MISQLVSIDTPNVKGLLVGFRECFVVFYWRPLGNKISVLQWKSYIVHAFKLDLN